MTVASDLVNLAFKDAGVFGTGQTPSADDQADALRRLNMMISQWSRRRWLVYHLVDTAFVCTGAQSYTVGTGGNFNITRPDRLEDAYVRQIVPASPAAVDFPLDIIEAREDYDRIRLKTLAASPPMSVFYDSDYPMGKVYPWPLPNANWELHIVTKVQLQSFAALTDTVTLPPEYEEAIYAALMQRLRIAYRLPADSAINAMARAALATIRKSNFQIARLKMPKALRRGPAYNVYSDRGR